MADPAPYTREDKAAQPPLSFADFKASVVRAPTKPLVRAPHTLTEVTGPSGEGVWNKLMGPAVTDLTSQHKAAPIGERIIVSGRVLDENDRPVPGVMIGSWMAPKMSSRVLRAALAVLLLLTGYKML